MPFEKKIICLMGPTASGKTELAMYLNDQFPSRIISVDSALIYQDMNIGTAKPSLASLKQHPHDLIDIIPPTARYSAASFRVDALALIETAWKNEEIPILVGGTFLYFKVLLEGISDLPETNLEIQSHLMSRVEAQGILSLYQELKQVDPISAERLHPNDIQRVMRALEVYLNTGTTLTQFWQAQKKSAFAYPCIKLALMPEDIQVANANIARRFQQMLKDGFIDEVAQLKLKYPDLTIEDTSQRAVGYRQVWEYLRGDYDKTVLSEKGIIATRQYAKRQRTWLRSEDHLHLISVAKQVPCADAFTLLKNQFL